MVSPETSLCRHRRPRLGRMSGGGSLTFSTVVDMLGDWGRDAALGGSVKVVSLWRGIGDEGEPATSPWVDGWW